LHLLFNIPPASITMLYNSRSLPTVVVSVVFLILAFLSFLLRMWTRFIVLRSPGLEDYLIMVAMVWTQGCSKRKKRLILHSYAP